MSIHEPFWREMKMDFPGEAMGGTDYKDYKVAALGPRSYFFNSKFNFEPPACMLVGKYTASAEDALFIANIDHDYACATNYPLYILDNRLQNQFRDDEYHHPAGRQIILGNDCWVGTRALVRGGVRLGNGSIVAAGAVVTKSVPPYAIVGGNPARIIKYRFPEEICRKLNVIKWWNWPEEQIVANGKLMEDPEALVAKFYRPFEKVDNETSRQIAGLRRPGGRLFGACVDSHLFLPDGRFLFEHILERFQRFAIPEDRLLLLIPASLEQTGRTRLQERRQELEQLPNVYLIHMETDFLYPVLQELDYYLVGREPADNAYVDYADLAETELLFGADQDPFRKLR